MRPVRIARVARLAGERMLLPPGGGAARTRRPAVDTADVYPAWVPGNRGGESEEIERELVPLLEREHIVETPFSATNPPRREEQPRRHGGPARAIHRATRAPDDVLSLKYSWYWRRREPRCSSSSTSTWSSSSRRTLPTKRSEIAFIFGARTAARITFAPTPRASRSSAGPNLSSRSRSRTAGASPSMVALRRCCAVHACVGPARARGSARACRYTGRHTESCRSSSGSVRPSASGPPRRSARPRCPCG